MIKRKLKKIIEKYFKTINYALPLLQLKQKIQTKYHITYKTNHTQSEKQAKKRRNNNKTKIK